MTPTLTFRDLDTSIAALTAMPRTPLRDAAIDRQVAQRERLMTYAPGVVATLNAWLRGIGVDVVLRAGRGYFYFTGADARADHDGVFVYRAYHLPLERWVDEALAVIELARDA
jgi:hypothetical protein